MKGGKRGGPPARAKGGKGNEDELAELRAKREAARAAHAAAFVCRRKVTLDNAASFFTHTETKVITKLEMMGLDYPVEYCKDQLTKAVSQRTDASRALTKAKESGRGDVAVDDLVAAHAAAEESVALCEANLTRTTEEAAKAKGTNSAAASFRLTPQQKWEPYAFDGATGEWTKHSTPEAPLEAEASPPRKSLRCATYNCWFELGYCFEARTVALLAELQATKSDIMCLQEVTPQLLARLTQSEWVREGYLLSEVPSSGHVVGHKAQATLTSSHIFCRGSPPATMEAATAWLIERIQIIEPDRSAATELAAALVQKMRALGLSVGDLKAMGYKGLSEWLEKAPPPVPGTEGGGGGEEESKRELTERERRLALQSLAPGFGNAMLIRRGASIAVSFTQPHCNRTVTPTPTPPQVQDFRMWDLPGEDSQGKSAMRRRLLLATLSLRQEGGKEGGSEVVSCVVGTTHMESLGGFASVRAAQVEFIHEVLAACGEVDQAVCRFAVTPTPPRCNPNPTALYAGFS